MRFRLSPSAFTLAITSNPLSTFAAQNVRSGYSEVHFRASGSVRGGANGEASTIGPDREMQREINLTAQLQARLDARQRELAMEKERKKQQEIIAKLKKMSTEQDPGTRGSYRSQSSDTSSRVHSPRDASEKRVQT